MIFVVTKLSTGDYDGIVEWDEVMELMKDKLRAEILARYPGANPTVTAISQDFSKPKRVENIPGTE